MSLFSMLPFPTLAMLCATALIAGMARGFSGFGAALIFVPFAAKLIGPQMASPLLLVTDAIVAAPLIYSSWPHARRTEVGMMALGGLIGAPLGTLVLKTGDPLSLRWLIAGLTLLTLILLLSGWRYRGQPRPAFTVSVGAISGLFSGIAQIGGPPVVAYWLGGAIKAATMRASTILFFAVGSATTLVSYWIGGLLVAEVFKLSAIILIFFAGGLYLGNHMFGLASEQVFRRVSYALIAFSLVISLPVWGRTSIHWFKPQIIEGRLQYPRGRELVDYLIPLLARNISRDQVPLHSRSRKPFIPK